MFYCLNTVPILNTALGHSPQISELLNHLKQFFQKIPSKKSNRYCPFHKCYFVEKMCSRLRIIGSIEKRFILKPPCNLSKSAFIRFNLSDTFWNPFRIFSNRFESFQIPKGLKFESFSNPRSGFLKRACSPTGGT